MLKISKLADYGTRILFVLANRLDERLSASEVAEATHIALPTVSKVLKLLNEAELVNSERGVNGGYQLARAPEAIGMADIIGAIDGAVAVTECNKGDTICGHSSICELRSHWQLINGVILTVLKRLTLADLRSPQTLEKFKQYFEAFHA